MPSNITYITYNLDVLANSTQEISSISERLRRPSDDLVGSIAEPRKWAAEPVAEFITTFLTFEGVRNIHQPHEGSDNGRSFRNECQDGVGILSSVT
jgi:hypothetical protein